MEIYYPTYNQADCSCQNVSVFERFSTVFLSSGGQIKTKLKLTLKATK